MQTELSFTTHEAENNTESQTHLEHNRAHFSEQCKRVFDLLMSGANLTVYEAMITHGIASFPRRVKDLKDRGVRITDAWYNDGTNKFKRYWMTAEDKESNKKFK